MPEYDLILRDGQPGEVVLEGQPANPESCYLLQDVQGLDSRDLRENVLENPDRDGDYLAGVRQAGLVVVVDAIVVGVDKADVRTRERALRAALAPTTDTWPMRIAGRLGDPEDLTADVRVSNPLRAPNAVRNGQRLQPAGFSLRAAESVLYGVTEHQVTVTPAVETDGFTFPLHFPLSFQGSVAAGTVVTAAGDAPSWPVLRLYGPMTDFLVENLTTGGILTFPGTVQAGTFLEVSPATKAITLGGDPAQTRYSELDRPASTWWPLEPGDNAIRLRAASWAPPARLELLWRDAYL